MIKVQINIIRMVLIMGQARYADRVASLSSNAIREILKLTQKPEIISFAGGLPAPDSFPMDEIKEIMMDIVTNLDAATLQYGITEGYVPLREEIVKMVKPLGMDISINDILVTTGSQQGLDLVSKAFLNKGDTVLVESPTYLSALQVFKLYEANCVAAPVDAEGVDPVALDKLLAEDQSIKALYMIPTFQNPSGCSISLERRRAIMEVVAKYDILVLEDNPYGDLRYSGEVLPTLSSFDTQAQVVYLGSFSKTIAPGLRVGFSIASPYVMSKLIIGKQACDLHSPLLTQRIIAEFLSRGLMKAHLDEVNAMYKTKRDVMLGSLEKYMPEGVTWTKPDGGLFLWAQLPAHLNSMELFHKAIAKNVAFVAGESFFVNGEPRNTMRLNFSNASVENIEKGIRVLAEVIKENI